MKIGSDGLNFYLVIEICFLICMFLEFELYIVDKIFKC